MKSPRKLFAALLLAVTTTAAAQTVNAPIPVGTDAAAIGVNPVTNKIYVANQGSNSVTVIDGGTQPTVAIPVGSEYVGRGRSKAQFVGDL